MSTEAEEVMGLLLGDIMVPQLTNSIISPVIRTHGCNEPVTFAGKARRPSGGQDLDSYATDTQ